MRWVLHVIPMFRPEIATTPAGPAVTHSTDFSVVTVSKPATPGEVLSLFATGLGPTRPGLDPGQPFPSNSSAIVNSPISVTVNGKSAEVLAAVGYGGWISSEFPVAAGHGGRRCHDSTERRLDCRAGSNDRRAMTPQNVSIVLLALCGFRRARPVTLWAFRGVNLPARRRGTRISRQ